MRMRIQMLGHTGVGKTSYMASMYGAMYEGIQGFSLRAEDPVAGKALLESAQAIAQGRYPEPTDQRARYRFKLRYKDKTFFKLTWLDYRGGALTEAGSSVQARELFRDLRKADGILVFCDGEALARKGSGGSEIGRMMNLLGQSLCEIEKPMRLAIVLTKADLVPGSNGHVPAPLVGLQEAIRASETVKGTIIRVACGQRPLNVEKPVLFVLREGIRSLVSELESRASVHEELRKHFESRRGFWNDVISDFLGKSSNRQLAIQQGEEAQKLLREIEPLTLPAKALGKHLKDLTVFGGNEL